MTCSLLVLSSTPIAVPGDKMDVSNASSAGCLADVDMMDPDGRNVDKLVAKKEKTMKRFRKSLSKSMSTRSSIERDGSLSTAKRNWLNNTITIRTPWKKNKAKESRHLSDYVIGTGSTLRELPTHVKASLSPVQEVDCRKLAELKRVGSGSQAVVYSSEYAGTKIAVKVLRKELAAEKAELAAFEREVNLLAHLTHPYINSVIGAGIVDESPCAVLEWCETDASRYLQLEKSSQKSVRQKVRSEHSSKVRLRIVSELAEALCFLHSGHALPKCFIAHRDIKPENVGLVASGRAKLLDFGLAVCLTSQGEEIKDPEATWRSKVYDMVYDLTAETGTLRYMSREVAYGKKYGLKADVYSFAVVAWEILVVCKPFVGMNSQEYKNRVCGQGLRPNLPEGWCSELKAIFEKAWHHNPSTRPNFDQICKSLQPILARAGSEGYVDPLGETTTQVDCCC